MEQIQKFEALLSISEAIGTSLSIHQTLERVFDKVLEVTQFSKGAIRLLETKNNCFRMVVNVGAPRQLIRDLETIPIDQSFQADVLRTKRPVFTTDLPSDPRLISQSEIDAGVITLVCIPLIASDQVVGTMELVSGDRIDIPEEDLRWFAAIGRQVGCNVRLMQLSEYNQDSAVLQERTRLSRELHDNLAQLVASIRIRTEEALICMEREDTAFAQSIIMEIEALTRDLSSSLRDEILGLRVEDISEQGLIPVLREHVDRYQRQWGIDTQLRMSKLITWEVSPTVEIQLLRIVQEALSNVRRHARANKVDISIREKDVGWLICIDDDGIGFEPEEVSQEHIGLRSMKERATSFGGSLNIESMPDCGTHILIEVPGRPVHQSLLKELAE